MIGVGVVGYGYWGPNLVRNLFEHQDVRLACVCDAREERLGLVRRRYPGVPTTSHYDELLADPTVDAVVVCTPVDSHYALALQALQSGRHVLVEKPLASSVDQAARLLEEANRRGLRLMVDHTFVFSPAVRKISEILAAGALGSKVYYYDSVRVNLGLFQHDVNVLWDLATHDLAIMDFVLPCPPVAVSATGVAHLANQPENLAYLTCFYPDDLIGHVHVNWLAPVKVRQTLIGGDRKMIVYNDLEPSEKLRVYDSGVTVTRNGDDHDSILIDYRAGDMWAPKVPLVEALHTEVAEFVAALQNRGPFPSDGEAGLRVVQVLEAASCSMRNRGVPVELGPVPVGA